MRRQRSALDHRVRLFVDLREVLRIQRLAARQDSLLDDLLEAWRDARRTAWQTLIKVITTGILAALLVGAAIKLKLMGGVQ